jgi:hypothetical protein
VCPRSSCVNRADQPFTSRFDEAEAPLAPLNARRSAADSWNITSRTIAQGFRSLLVDLDLATIEGHLLLLEPIEGAAQRPLIDGRPYFARRARTECIERLAITRERTLDSSGVGIDDRSGSGGRGSR